MKLFELDPNNPIDRELAKTSQDAAKDGSMDPDDIEAQEDPQLGAGGEPVGGDPMNQPDPAMTGAGGEEPMAEPEGPAKPVNSALLAQVQGHDYIQNYDHDNETSPTNPLSILNLDASGLSDLRKRIRVHLDKSGLEDRVGSYANPETKAANDMLAFVDLVMMHKKKAAKDTKATSSNKPRVQNAKPPKTEAGQVFKAKRN